MTSQVKKLLLLQFYAAVLLYSTSSQAQSISSDKEFLLVSVHYGPGTGIYKVDAETGSSTRLPLPTTTFPYGVAYDETTQTVFWADRNNGGSMAEAKVDGSGYRLLSNAYPQAMIYDKSEDILFYSKVGSHDVHQLQRNTLADARLLSGHMDGQLAQDASKRLLYFVDTTKQQVMQYDLRRGVSKAVITGAGILGVAVSPAGDIIYAGSRDGVLTVLYKYNLVSGALTTFTLPFDIKISRLEVSHQHLYILDMKSDVTWTASLSNLNSWKKIFEIPGSHLADTSLVFPLPKATKPTVTTVCAEKDNNPLCPRMASDGKCSQPDVLKYCRKSCLC